MLDFTQLLKFCYNRNTKVEWKSKTTLSHKTVADGGKDALDNVIAICPNCHKKMHIMNNPNDVEFLLGIAADYARLEGLGEEN